MSRRIACVRVPAWRTGGPPPAPEARAALAGALLAAAPRVTPARGHPCAFWADASGMERRGGDAAVARSLLAAARDAGFPGARVGIAGCCVAAAAATRSSGSPWRVVTPGGDAAFLSRAPLRLLPLAPDVRAALALLGLQRCGELADLPPDGVELRLGADGLHARRLARGDDPRWPFRPPPADGAGAEVELDAPVETAEPLRFLLAGLVAQVTAQLAERGRIPARLRLTLRLDRAEDRVREVRPARPTADPRVLGELCRRMLEEEPLPGMVAGLVLEAPEEGTARADQLDAFRAPAPDPGALHGALLPLLAKWGPGALSRAARQGAHLPGEEAAWEERGSEGIALFTALPSRAADEPVEAGPPRADLPLCLRRLPEPAELRVDADGEGRPVAVHPPPNLFRDGKVRGYPPRVWKTRSEGPERISGAWWDRGSAREYWRVESAEGWLGLVFRDGGSGRWFLDGWYD